MESRDNLDISISGGGFVGGASRWNPTKEQTDMLESLYKQGVRTPSVDQIQQITNRLRPFGQIEGKNVFYWFQNHKARQRQKQKQDHVSYVNRFLHKSSAYASYPNALCSPYYMPYPEVGSCQQQQPKVLLPRSFKRRPILPERPEKNKLCGRAVFDQARLQACNPILQSCSKVGGGEECMNVHPKHYFNMTETLDLFPIHPSGNLLQPPRTSSAGPSTSIANFPAISSSPFVTKRINNDQGASEDRAFIDFLCGNGSCNSH